MQIAHERNKERPQDYQHPGYYAGRVKIKSQSDLY